MNMEFLNKNLVNTTTQITPSVGGTASAGYLFNRFTNKLFGSGDASDATTTTIQITFDVTETVDRIILQDINLKSFKIYADTTTNLFTLSNGLTNSSNWTNNSVTSLYLICNTTSVKDLYIVASTTMAINQEKQIGELWVTHLDHRLTNNPPAGGYKPLINRKDYNFETSDGGVDIYYVQENFKAGIDLQYVKTADQASFRNIYSGNDDFIFVPMPTGTAWDGDIYAVNWDGDFDLSFTRDYVGGDDKYNIKIMMKEIPK